jgi:hypothetical protein
MPPRQPLRCLGPHRRLCCWAEEEEEEEEKLHMEESRRFHQPPRLACFRKRMMITLMLSAPLHAQQAQHSGLDTAGSAQRGLQEKRAVG